jgi:hypothetical protein
METPAMTPMEAAHAFLRRTAKIIVVIDTHSLEEDGTFICGGVSGAYTGCTLLQILEGCISRQLYQYLLNTNDSPVHGHQSMILNLACGSTISLLSSRHSLLQGYAHLVVDCTWDFNVVPRNCSEGVLLFANEITIVSDVTAPLVAFALQWVQSNSDFDSIIASAFTPTWTSLHHPVISSHSSSHVLYMGLDSLKPHGHIVTCH